RTPIYYLITFARVILISLSPFFFRFTYPPTPELSPLSLHDALPISIPTTLPVRSWGKTSCSISSIASRARSSSSWTRPTSSSPRSEEHTSELQSRENLVCRLLLEKKKTKNLLKRCL